MTFTQENTEGYTDNQLRHFNRRLSERLAELNPTGITGQVAEKLTEQGIPAYSHHTGGNLFCVVVEGAEVDFWFGNSLDVWAGDTFTKDGEFIDGEYGESNPLETSIPSDSQDVEAIAAAIEHIVRNIL